MTSYESKVAGFLALLVLFLAVVSFQSMELSRRSQAELDAEFERRARDTAAFVEEKLRAVDLAGEDDRAHGASTAVARILMDLEVRYTLAGIQILDDRGVPLFASEPREPTPEPELFGLESEEDRVRLLAGEQVLGEAYQEPFGDRVLRTAYRPLEVPGRPGRGMILAVSFEARSPSSLARLYGTLVVYQALGFLAVLVLLFVFVRWFMRPYRALMNTAKAAGLGTEPARADETVFVVETFRETIARLKDREEKLRRLHLREKARADEQARLATHITRSMASGVVVFGPEGRLDFMNRAAEEILRVAASAMPGADPAAVFSRAGVLGSLVRDTLHTGEIHPRCEVELAIDGGEARSLGASTFPILDDDGRVAGALALLTDLTDIKALQERMRLRENLASLGEMSAGIAHEFRNSLAAILGYASLLQKRDPPGLREDIEAIRVEAEGLNRVVSDFLRFARPIVPVLQPLDLKRLVAECVRDLKSQEEFQDVVFDQQDLLPVHVSADDVLLRQALGNLLRNAAQAAGAGGRPPWVQIRGFKDTRSGKVHLTILDNGPGVPEELRERVFLPFFTTKDRGTGLGLAITQKIILAHDGEIRIEGGSGDGALFLLTLPELAASPGDAGTAAPAA